ncbi:5-oxoprolinase subunit PxpA [Roseivirga pacifica]|uniref:5-oxoprolinase subunit PxpA n=1 Tax=Roseivirga pacifica TaxID=1267423 RepID=UPI003BB11A31
MGLTKSIDINCDMGESYGNYHIGNDTALMPYINSANIACGMHGGDPVHIERTICLALEHNVRIGAHPGYPDLQGFGRRVIAMKPEELASFIKYQVAALKGLVEANGGKLAYVKPHGALYNHIAQNKADAQVVIQAIRSIDSSLSIMGLAGSHMKTLVEEAGSTFIAEAFADRRYEIDGKLRSRSLPDALITNPKDACEQVLSIANALFTQTLAGDKVSLVADSFCIHGDNPAALAIAQSLNEQIKGNS